MDAQVSKWGNSYALRIPAAMAKLLNVTEGSKVDLAVEEGALVVRPARARLHLADLLAGVNENNLHAETPTGKTVGNEI